MYSILIDHRFRLMQNAIRILLFMSINQNVLLNSIFSSIFDKFGQMTLF